MEKNQDFKNLTDDQLEEVAEAGMKEQIVAGALGIAALVGSANFSKAEAVNNVNTGATFSSSQKASVKLSKADLKAIF